MNSETIQMIWEFANSGVGLVIAGAVLTAILGWLHKRKPHWEKFEGAIIAGVKFAEKAIEENTENKGAKRFAAALEYVLKVYEQTHNKRPSRKTLHALKEEIVKTHADLENAKIL